MAQTLEQIVETHLKVIDAASGPLAKIAAQAEKTANQMDKAGKAAAHGGEAGAGAFGTLFDTLKNMAGIGAVVGGALSLHSAIESTEKYMNNLKQVHEITGATVSQTDFLLSSARRAGVGYDTMVNAMTRLSKKGAMLATSQAAMSQQVPGMGKRFAALGVDLKKGPVASMEAMSKAVKTGKIGVGELMGQFGIPAKEAADMRDFLNELDPQKLAAAKKGGGGLIGDTEMTAFKAIESAQNRIADTWNRIKVTVISKLYPIVANMAEGFAGKLERALPKIESAMQWVSDHMDGIVVAAKAFVAAMTAKKMFDMVEKLTSKEGIIGKIAEHGLKGLTGEGPGLMAKIFGKAAVAAKAAIPGAAAAGTAAASGVAGAAGAAGAGTAAAPAVAAIKGILPTLLAAAPIFLAIAAAIAVVALIFRAISKNIEGVGDAFWAVVYKIEAQLSVIGDRIAALFGGNGSLSEFLGTLLDWAGYILASGIVGALEGISASFSFLVAVFDTLTELGDPIANIVKRWADLTMTFAVAVIDPMMEMIRSMGDLIRAVVNRDVVGAAFAAQRFIQAKNQAANAADTLMSGFGKAVTDTGKSYMDTLADKMYAFDKAAGRKEAQLAADRVPKKRPEDTKPPDRSMNFPNARFDITQNFAEGFDPDRIAVAFANDIASLGEMRSSSTMVLATSGAR